MAEIIDQSRAGCPPVLLAIFNRPHLLPQVMDSIRRARPARLYLAADGPRDRGGEAALCAKARRIATDVDWDCTVQTLFRDRNLGCRLGVSTAIDWFFEHEAEGIILEDDCVPLPGFYRYCRELLELYRNEPRIMGVSGSNHLGGRRVTPCSYYFSRTLHCWGWATWRRAWARYDRDLARWPAFKAAGGLKAWSDGDPTFEAEWTGLFDNAPDIDSWYYRYQFSCWAHGGLSCIPASKLVANIGFGPNATHTTDPNMWQAKQPAHDLDFPLVHPAAIVRIPTIATG